jgi:hypothetical protein
VEGKTADLDLWRFAACNQFPALERYCRKDKGVRRQLKDIMKDPDRGIHYMIREWQLPINLVGQVVSEIIAGMDLDYAPLTSKR